MTRRRLLAGAPAVALLPYSLGRGALVAQTGDRRPGDELIGDAFPRHDPATAREIVGASHGNVARVTELVSARPALARAAWDWGYGDWETALGAASHVGNKEIAAVLLAAGAHPTIFSAAMLGQVDVVRSLVRASPGIQKTRGPHGITLLDHARAGNSAEVVKYLESVGDANVGYPSEPFGEGDPDSLLGVYAFGARPQDRFVASRNSRGVVVIKREGAPERNLFHHGGRVFNPAGAEAVRIRFAPASGPASAVIVTDGEVIVRATRVTG